MAYFKITMLLLQVIPGLVLIAVSVPLIRGKIGPNPWYGFRVRRTLEDPAVWYKANAYAGKTLIWAAIAMIVGSVLLYLFPGLDGPTYAVACTVVVFVALVVAVTLSFRFLGQIPKSKAS
jgi:uncharacterized membrane protein